MLKQELITTLQHLARSNEYNTDKDTTHSYLELYDLLFAPYCKNGNVTLLEIGNHQGGSIELWDDYFDDCQIFGLERNTLESLAQVGQDREKVHLMQGVDAYQPETVENLQNEEVMFDIIIDDGSHQPTHQLFVLNEFMSLLKPEGTMVIEDVVSLAMAANVVSACNSLGPDDRIAIFDRTNVKGTPDDIVIVVKKGRK